MLKGVHLMSSIKYMLGPSASVLAAILWVALIG